jgi:hypothetical protein
MTNSKITGLFMGWTDPISNRWFPIKKMTWNEGKYYTVYLQGMRSAIAANPSKGTAVKAGLIKLDEVIITSDIEVSFKTRMPVNRPFTDVERLQRLGLPTDLTKFDPFEYVARSGGRSGADSSDIFPEFAPDLNGEYHYYFGIGAIEDVDINEYIHRVNVNDRLTVKDGRIFHKGNLVGEAPGYIKHLLQHHTESIDLTVFQVNDDIYKFGKLLCCAKINSRKCIPFTDFDYEPLMKISASNK